MRSELVTLHVEVNNTGHSVPYLTHHCLYIRSSSTMKFTVEQKCVGIVALYECGKVTHAMLKNPIESMSDLFSAYWTVSPITPWATLLCYVLVLQWMTIRIAIMLQVMFSINITWQRFDFCTWFTYLTRHSTGLPLKKCSIYSIVQVCDRHYKKMDDIVNWLWEGLLRNISLPNVVNAVCARVFRVSFASRNISHVKWTSSS